MNSKPGRWQWGAVLCANGLLWLIACLVPVSSHYAVAVDGKPAGTRPVQIRPEEISGPALDETDDANDLLPIGQVVFRDELDQPPLPRALLIPEKPAPARAAALSLERQFGQSLKSIAAEFAAALKADRRPDRHLAKAEVERVEVVERAAGVPQQARPGVIRNGFALPRLESMLKGILERPLDKKPLPVNPIGKLFEEIARPGAAKPRVPVFGGPARVLPANPGLIPPVAAGDKNSRQESARRRNAGDPSVAHDPKKFEWMQHALQQIQAKNWKSALDSLQRIVENSEDALFFREQREWVSIQSEAQRVIGTLPSEALELYRTQYSALSRQLLNRAVQGNDVELLSRVSRLYFHTSGGYEATDRLGNVHLDRGEFGLASRLFHTLWEVHAPPAQARSWRLKALLAFRKAGQKTWADALWQEIAAGLPPTLEIGGRPVDPRKWLEAQGLPVAPPLEPLAEWPVFFGNKQRTGRPVGSQPLLLNRWSQPTTQLETLRNNLENLADDEADKGTPPLPGFMPIMVGDRIAYRTFSGVQVVDAATGKPLWKTETDEPIEELLSTRTDVSGNPYAGNRRGILQFGPIGYQPGMDPQPLSNLAYRNSNFGQLSSDGTRLFVLEDPQAASPRQPGHFWGEDITMAAQPQTNTLTAYDLATGRPVWEAGGEDYGEAFQLPLAGYFFFGTPLFDGHELLLVGEQLKKNEIRLFGLDPATGKVRWSQLVGVAELGISRDIFRRWWSAPTATGEGVIVTPTTANWIVGVDRLTHSLLWGHHFPRRATGNNGPQHETQAMVQQVALFGRWYPSPPIIARQRVIHAPQEANLLVCLDLFSGKELWQIPRSDMLAVAGVFDETVLLIGRSALVAVSLQNGQPLWKVPTTPIVGRGTAVGERYYLPCAGGELWKINLENGQVVEKLYLSNVAGASESSSTNSLGNLTFYQGMLLSLTTRDLTAYEQQDTLNTQIADRLRKNPHDPWGNLRQAEIHLLRREAGPALASIGNILEREVPPDLAARYREVAIESLTLAVRADFSRDIPDAIERLEVLSLTPRQRLSYRRLIAERQVSRKQYGAAFDTYMSLASEQGDTPIVTGDGNVKVRLSAWIQGQMSNLWKMVPESQRVELETRVRERAVAVMAQSPDAQSQFVNLFREHPAARDVTRQLIEQLAGQREFLQAERLLLRWRRGDDRALAAEATERLARLMREFDLPGDAAHYYADLESRYGDVKLAGGQTGVELVAGLRSSGKLPAKPALPDWSHRSARTDRLGSNYSDQQRQDLSRSGSRLPFFRQHLVQMIPVDQRLDLVRLDTGAPYWSLPLRSRLPQGHVERVTAETSEHQMTIMHQGVIHGLSPVERKVLWTRTLEQRPTPNYYYNHGGYGSSPPMQSLGAYGGGMGLGRDGLRRRSRMHYSQGMPQQAGLSFANTEIVGYQGRRTFTVLDAASGEVLWSHDRVRPGTRIIAGPEIVCIVPPNGQAAQILRAIDGQPVSSTAMGTSSGPAGTESWRSVIDLVGARDLILTVPEGNSSTKVKRFDPVANREVWSVHLPRSAFYSLLENDWLAILQPDGWYKSLDLETGRLHTLVQVPSAERLNQNELFSVIDYDNLYLIVNNQSNQNYYYNNGIPLVKASGVVYAIDLETRKLRWKQKVEGQNLLLERLDYLPALVFATQRYEQRNRMGYSAFYLQVLDKKTGQMLLKESSQSQNGFQALWLHPADQAIELRGYQERIRITAPIGTAANPDPPQSPVSKPTGPPTTPEGAPALQKPNPAAAKAEKA